MTATTAQVFVSNVLNGTVTRLDLVIPGGHGVPKLANHQPTTVIASGYAHRTDPNTLVVAPTGLAYNAQTGTLYVASTADNAIYAVPNAGSATTSHGKGSVVVSGGPHLHGPLGLTQAPNGDLIVANGDAVSPDPNQPNELAEFTPQGRFVAQFQVDSGNPGAAFGLAAQVRNNHLTFAAVDDNTNALKIWTLPS